MCSRNGSYLMFVFSYAPFICMFIFTVFAFILLLMAILDQCYIIEINTSHILNVYFEPVAIVLFFLALFISVPLAIFYWIDINSNDKIVDADKKRWKKLYFKISLFANAFYYDYKYDIGKPQYVLEAFFQKSRDKMFGYVDKP